MAIQTRRQRLAGPTLYLITLKDGLAAQSWWRNQIA